jgi:hypothetical protein
VSSHWVIILTTHLGLSLHRTNTSVIVNWVASNINHTLITNIWLEWLRILLMMGLIPTLDVSCNIIVKLDLQ